MVPVPLGRRRRRERGYNQAEVVAAVWARAWDLPLHAGLRRIRETGPQVGGDITWRQLNVAGAFAADGGCSGSAVLVDDVATTGATLSAAADALHEGGAQRVTACVLARRL